MADAKRHLFALIMLAYLLNPAMPALGAGADDCASENLLKILRAMAEQRERRRAGPRIEVIPSDSNPFGGDAELPAWWSKPPIPKDLPAKTNRKSLENIDIGIFGIDAVFGDPDALTLSKPIPIEPRQAASVRGQYEKLRDDARNAMLTIAKGLQKPFLETTISDQFRLNQAKTPAEQRKILNEVAQRNEAYRTELKRYALRVASVHLETNGVKHEIVFRSGHPAIRLLPEPATPLGRWVTAWKQRRPEIDILFDPFMLIEEGVLGSFQRADRVVNNSPTINIGVEAIVKLDPREIVTLHETGHAHADTARVKGQKLFMQGRVDSPDAPLPHTEGLYSKGFSFDEIIRWHGDLIFTVAAGRGKTPPRLLETDALKIAERGYNLTQDAEIQLGAAMTVLDDFETRNMSEAIETFGLAPRIETDAKSAVKAADRELIGYSVGFHSETGDRVVADLNLHWWDGNEQVSTPHSIPLEGTDNPRSMTNVQRLRERLKFMKQVSRDRAIIFSQSRQWLKNLAALAPPGSPTYRKGLDVLQSLIGNPLPPGHRDYKPPTRAKFIRAWQEFEVKVKAKAKTNPKRGR